MSIEIITDSTSYLSPEDIRQLGIHVVPLSVHFGEEEYKENQISNEDFYAKMERCGVPTSSQPSPAEIESIFDEILSRGNEAVCVLLSSAMSGTCTSARLARDMVLEKNPFANIRILDSMSNSMQLGFAALSGAKAAFKNLDMASVTEAVVDTIRRSRYLFIPKTLTHLERGGRIGKANALIGNLLKIIPILTVEEGVTGIYKKVRTRQNALTAILDKLVEDIKNFGGLTDIIVHHINCLDDAKELAASICARLNLDHVTIRDIGPIVGMHVGPGAIAVVYCTKNQLREIATESCVL